MMSAPSTRWRSQPPEIWTTIEIQNVEMSGIVFVRVPAQTLAASHRKVASRTGRARRHFDDVVRGCLFLAGGTHAGVTGFGAKLLQVARAEITHSALHAADQVGEHVVN